ncbi:3-dehydroquinate synthase [Corynebacterium glucuronolyticum]|uniref:3-dehydroquinate synthase n=1 Tax=Corynebacterium glucuronolyticum TaxID=39791 RepID=A0A7T4JUC0_9CORY|nr:3-dehydroquinate synthase [Corynebacterium glucuronolyticum]EEI26551.1 3-dehydroquinate synthase [Corynebacterium glucuronolyticum ATCC 51867]QQB45661.1 3-dehydroquinate synthase [Corynebacterium glucuronolyticum]QRO83168.1 3-dehydroquinate synthase [Corynebacterium glucuronolyticum]WKD63669.1 3-dehydroquinate synthase [Corynebacterium glucuronolyticum DSM 44120]SMB80880.1 3-dehydroquinate synthase [Corynebacterium glucuronolyticum]
MPDRQSIVVNAQRQYTVTIGNDLKKEVVAFIAGLEKARHVVLVHQPTLAHAASQLESELSLSGLVVTLAEIPDAEAGKTSAVLEKLWDLCGENNICRSDVVVGLGGGAATDLAGFLAATWMRGVPLVNIPTSLLGMVDAAVGGKTGINSSYGKNLVGSFYEPNAVFVDLDFLSTLPEEDLISGAAEIIKCGFIKDPAILEIVEKNPACFQEKAADLTSVITRSIQVKADVVSQDLRESGLREILNYGHTFGHGVENYEQYTWKHGYAVAVGMVFAAQLAKNRGLITQDLVDRHIKILDSVGLPTTYKQGIFGLVYESMKHDKKARAGKLRFVCLEGVGKTTRVEGPSFSELRAAYEALAAE